MVVNVNFHHSSKIHSFSFLADLKKQLQSEKKKESNISAEKGNIKQWEFET